MRKIISTVFAFLAAAFGIALLGYANDIDISFIGLLKFAAEIGILAALTGGCAWVSWRLDDEKERF